MIIKRYIFRELLTTFLLILAAVTGMAFIGSAYQLFRTFEGLGLKFIMLAAPTILILMLPYTILASITVAATLVYGRLSADNEITALKTSGIHINKALYPAFIICVMLCLVCFLLNMYIAPQARYRRKLMTGKAITELFRSPPQGKTDIKLANYVFQYSFFQDGIFHNIFISYLEKDKPKDVYNAQEGELAIEENKPPLIVLKNCQGTNYEDDKTTEFHAEQLPLELNVEDVYQPKTINDMSINELLYLKNDRTAEARDRELAIRNIHFRLARSLVPLALILVAIPLGIFVRKGSKLAGLGTSLPPLLLYFIFSQALEGPNVDKTDIPYMIAYLPVATLVVIAIPLFVWLYKR